MDSFAPLARALRERDVRYVMIGVWGANFWAHHAGIAFATLDRDVFLPPDPANLLSAWRTCADCGLTLTCGPEPLDEPRDLWLAERVVEQRALTRAADGGDLQVDLTLTMAGFEFEEAWAARRTFAFGDAQVHVARLMHIVQSKAAAGRAKDQLFLATHAEAVQNLLPTGDRARFWHAVAASREDEGSSPVDPDSARD